MSIDKIDMLVTMDITNTDLDHFKALSDELISLVDNNEPGTMEYGWYIDDSQQRAYVRECYPDSDAFLGHLGLVGEKLGPLSEIAPMIDIVFFGNLSDEAKAAVDGFPVRFAGLYKQIER
jgi:quinol monooxygenase YgiN